jgi:AcrR family transcriptional regulator
MELKFSVQLNEKLYLRDPETSDLGKRIVKNAIVMIYELGLEAFTFKKLAERIQTTEASIYRYFENKHRLLLYIIAWYWNYLEYMVVFNLNNLEDSGTKIQKVIELLVLEFDDTIGALDIDKKALYQIVINESSKVYLIKEVEDLNAEQVFKPYKDLCARIADLMRQYNANYLFPHSLSSTLIETAHSQHFFMEHLPRLTDFGQDKRAENIVVYLSDLVFSTLNANKK